MQWGGTTTPPLHQQSIIKMATKRNTYYATICYPESAPDNWIEILEDFHIQALISPLHDKDINQDGTLKKAHYHIILLFESLKSEKQVQEIVDRFGGIKTIPIHSLGAYCRYLCHLDDPDKMQYKIEDVIELGGANYRECCRTNDSEKDEKNLMGLTQLILDNDISYFHKVVEAVLAEHKEWFHALTANSYYIHSVVMSLATEKQRKEKVYI